MKKVMFALMCAVLVFSILLPLSGAYAAGKNAQGEDSTTKNIGTEKAATTMTKNRDGELKPNEYEVISMDGGITRAFCPYTCAMRGLEVKHCKAWRSLSNPKLCYVQDTRIKTDPRFWTE